MRYWWILGGIVCVFFCILLFEFYTLVQRVDDVHALSLELLEFGDRFRCYFEPSYALKSQVPFKWSFLNDVSFSAEGEGVDDVFFFNLLGLPDLGLSQLNWSLEFSKIEGVLTHVGD